MTFIEKFINQKLQVLDAGFIRVVDVMGDDRSIVEAARISYGTTATDVTRDRGLIRYLMKNRHTSPFEMCEIKLHLKMPIFVARQWLRHRTANVNEYSGRYSIMNEDCYIPQIERIGFQSTTNHQGTEKGKITVDEQILAQYRIELLSKDCKTTYNKLIDSGISKELARIVLPVNTFTEMYWKIDLHNLLHFLKLRMADDAQEEIRVYARAIAEIVKEWVPLTYEAFIDYVVDAHVLSKEALRVIKTMINNCDVPNWSEFSLTKREISELEKIFDIKPH